MSQKEKDFQSKPRRGGQKFGGGGSRGPGGKGKTFGRSPRKEFGDRNEGDRPKRRFDGDSRPPRRDRDGGFGENRPKRAAFGRKETAFDRNRPHSSASGRNGRDFGDKPPRREFGDRPPRRDFGDRPRKSFGDKKFGDKPRRDFGDRPKRDFGDRPRKDFGDKKFGDKPFKKNDAERNAFLDRKFGGKPQKSFTRYEDDAAPKKDFGARLKSDRPSYGSPNAAYLYGIHPVSQALLNPKRLNNRLLCTEKGFESLNDAWQEAQSDGLPMPEVITVEKEDLERLLPRDAVHQDVLLDCEPLDDVFLDDVLKDAADNAIVLVLDQVTDPHNVGAILRSAAAFGAIAVVMQKLHAPDITGTLAKSASGAVEYVPLVREVNLSRSLEQLKEAGFFCIGLAEGGRSTLAKLKLTGKTALVLGAEGSGLRRLVAENCDELVKLPTQEPIGSLNVSNAAAVALYELVRAR